MRYRVGACWLASTVLLALAATARGQAVQLPSLSVFGVDTTVVVPDSGGAFIGGDRRISNSLSTFGRLPPNRGWGISRQAAGANLTATIHDPHEAEAALGGRLPRRGAKSPAATGPLRISAGSAASDAPLGSVAELAKRRTQNLTAAQREAQALFDKGQQARRSGKTAIARIYLTTAARQATGTLRSRIDAELAALAAGPTAKRAAPSTAAK